MRQNVLPFLLSFNHSPAPKPYHSYIYIVKYTYRVIFIKFKSHNMIPLIKILDRLSVTVRTKFKLFNVKTQALMFWLLFNLISPSPFPPQQAISTPNCSPFWFLELTVFLCRIYSFLSFSPPPQLTFPQISPYLSSLGLYIILLDPS